MKNIFITNLTTKVGNDDLKEIFEEYGIVSSAKVIMDHYTGNQEALALLKCQTTKKQKMLSVN